MKKSRFTEEQMVAMLREAVRTSVAFVESTRVRMISGQALSVCGDTNTLG